MKNIGSNYYSFWFWSEVDLTEILCNEMMPVPLVLAELNDLLKSEDKTILQTRLSKNIVYIDSINALLLMDKRWWSHLEKQVAILLGN